MRIKFSLLSLLPAAVALLLVVACGSATSPTPAPTPEPRTATTTPIPSGARDLALEFVREQRAIEEDWEKFHNDFDRWRTGLVSCDRSAVQVALRDFAGDLSQITAQARDLPRPAVARGLADRTIEAAEKEEAAVRELRDQWQPDSTALFEAVDAARSAAAATQKEVLDQLNDLREPSPSGSPDPVSRFSDAFAQINADWGNFHENYTSLREEQSGLSDMEVSDRLTQLVDDFSSISVAVNSLPSTGVVEEMATGLKRAAEAEGEALHDLSSSLQASAETPDATPESTPVATATPGPTPSSTATPEPTPDASAGTETPEASDSAALFEAMDSRVEASDGIRRQVEEDLQGVLENNPAANIDDINEFQQQYDLLVREWADFHQAYDEWRRTEGGCNRTEVIDKLGQFSIQFDELAGRVRDLPQASYVLPMENLLVEAAQREEEALRVLRNTWRPFAADAYRALDQERANAESLRRQAEIGTQELLERFNIPPSEV